MKKSISQLLIDLWKLKLNSLVWLKKSEILKELVLFLIKVTILKKRFLVTYLKRIYIFI